MTALKPLLRSFSFSIISTLLVVGATMYYLGWGVFFPLLTLLIIEITFSFDNAIVNAQILKKMSKIWQEVFLSVGIIIAVFGMRLVFPILMVAVTAGLPWREVIDLALNHPEKYAHHLELANPTLLAFGGAFLMMLTLHFFMAENKEHHWLEPVERPLQRMGRWWLPPILTVGVITLLSVLPANHYGDQTFKAGIVGTVVYVVLHGIMMLIGKSTSKTSKLTHYTGWAAATMFLYLEVLDASFSLDGVLGAFAITSDVILIAAGLGAGALWVRSLTVHMVRNGTLEAYRYLEHGAHYAIAVLATSMLLSAIFHVPEAIIGTLGVGVIVASLVASLKLNKHEAA